VGHTIEQLTPVQGSFEGRCEARAAGTATASVNCLPAVHCINFKPRRSQIRHSGSGKYHQQQGLRQRPLFSQDHQAVPTKHAHRQVWDKRKTELSRNSYHLLDKQVAELNASWSKEIIND